MGISFAIPIDEAHPRRRAAARERARRARPHRRADRPGDASDVAESIGLGRPQRRAGAQRREAARPADKAGVEAGDIITKFNGKAIDKPRDLPRMVGNTKPGTRGDLTVFRRGGSRDLNVTVAEFEPDKPTRVARARAEGEAEGLAGGAVDRPVGERTDRRAEEAS